ncbi:MULTISPECIES: hypothetical protein [Dyella]|uniref:BP74 N-terminal domain-containing protein n=2 Tax=Dyella TaxID=231454 RepID=A0A4R0YJ33_9GAMM|nr:MULTISPECIES: hypothetical protein [Dyella]TBR36106.1 hypothetical protein EYV96_16000 [Dyella terrae]TCI06155.1 hypothetical protein EZM97_35090 [Dyella soli]
MKHINGWFAIALSLVCSCAMAGERPPSRYFAFISYAGAPKIDANEFIVEVANPDVAAQFEDILRHRVMHPNIAFEGRVVPGRTIENAAWPYHLDPKSVKVGSTGALDECDSTPENIEANLTDVGGRILPGGWWCPWSMHLSREVLR